MFIATDKEVATLASSLPNVISDSLRFLDAVEKGVSAEVGVIPTAVSDSSFFFFPS